MNISRKRILRATGLLVALVLSIREARATYSNPYDHGYYLIAKGDFGGALAEFDRLTLKYPKGLRAVLWSYISRGRLAGGSSDSEDQALSKVLASTYFSDDSSEVPQLSPETLLLPSKPYGSGDSSFLVFRLYLGNYIHPHEIDMDIAKLHETDVDFHDCESYPLIGEWFVLHQDYGEARKYLQGIPDACAREPYFININLLARAELQRIPVTATTVGQPPAPFLQHKLQNQTPPLGSFSTAAHDLRLNHDRRVALVIGNSAYASVGKLQNPVHDGDAIATSLRNAGFSNVTVKDDLSRSEMIAALNNFSDQAANADWAVIYFSGHGLEVDGTNYVVPVDAKLLADRDVEDEAISLERLVKATLGAKKLHLVILDACRDDPFVSNMKRTVATRSIGRGLARIEPEGGTLVVYSAKDGEIAYDGDGQNSPFVTSLTKRIAQPNVDIGMLFRQVRDDVMAATGKKQEPYVYGSLPGENFYFVQR